MAARVVAFAALAATAFAKSALHWQRNGAPAVGSLSEVHGGWPQCAAQKQMSGYFDIQASTNKHYFYWAIESKRNPATDPVILWMTGGPGCSSGLALLVENGPCHINMTTGDMYQNPSSWNNEATVIYIDQPAGVGFSYGDHSGYDHNETMVGDDMYRFLLAFYQQFPQYLQNDLFVYGESYGGHFAPATAHRILAGNQAGGNTKIPLKGLSVGNGLTTPTVQYKWYGKLAYQWCKTVTGKPCISEAAYNQMEAALPKCMSLIDQCQKDVSACSYAQMMCNNIAMGPYEQSGLNVYDIRAKCTVPGLCYDFSKITAFYNRQDVQAALGVRPGTRWQSCNMQVNGMFSNDWMRNMNMMIPDLLHSNIRVMIYAGDVDFICNWLGNKAWTLVLPWAQTQQFAAATDLPWYHDTVEAGRFRTVASADGSIKNLFSFVQVHDAGHMVPMNQPERALTMVKHFITDTPFYGFAGPQ